MSNYKTGIGKTYSQKKFKRKMKLLISKIDSDIKKKQYEIEELQDMRYYLTSFIE